MKKRKIKRQIRRGEVIEVTPPDGKSRVLAVLDVPTGSKVRVRKQKEA